MADTSEFLRELFLRQLAGGIPALGADIAQNIARRSGSESLRQAFPHTPIQQEIASLRRRLRKSRLGPSPELEPEEPAVQKEETTTGPPATPRELHVRRAERAAGEEVQRSLGPEALRAIREAEGIEAKRAARAFDMGVADPGVREALEQAHGLRFGPNVPLEARIGILKNVIQRTGGQFDPEFDVSPVPVGRAAIQAQREALQELEATRAAETEEERTRRFGLTPFRTSGEETALIEENPALAYELGLIDEGTFELLSGGSRGR